MKRYVKVDNQQVFLTGHQQKAYDQMINSVRYRARREGRCGQPDYCKCCGDCGLCPWQKNGRILSTDYAARNDRYSFDAFELEDPGQSVEDDTINRLFFEQLYRTAVGIVPDRDVILRLHLEEGLKPYTIARRINVRSHAAIDERLKKLLQYIRDHRDELLG